ncbi:SDR family NAD(P)-dependent oxidoreductase [uncultured Mucilaginibacter sp.]|uniref:SDR family oxidoreductase n=1 Tax=uncultured Mucilaginibacter sp. TaxID=797541 RepID=UPI0025E03A3B|nr:SDR family NAD(P)-dependent oxidoreductase [uncultured Mucilaginibacter sp.]
MANFQTEIQSLEGKNILITGGTTGIGRATALALAAAGANVLIVGQDPQHLQDVLSDAEKAGVSNKIKSLIADLSVEDGIKAVTDAGNAELDTLHVLINCAALAYQGISDGNYAEWARVVNTNVLAYLALSNYAVKRMKEAKGGHIVNIGSMSADVREKDSSVYVATKGAVQAFSESLRKEVNELGIKVTLIEPGAVGTDMQPVSVPDQQKNIENLEMLKAEDIAQAVIYAITQPQRSDVVEIKIRPHLQII